MTGSVSNNSLPHSHNPGAAQSSDIDIKTLWQAILARKNWLILSMLVAGIGSYLILASMTPYYSSEARILIDRDETVFTSPVAGERRQDIRQIDEQTVASQVQVLTSRDLALEVGNKLRKVKNSEFHSAANDLGFFRQLLKDFGLSKGLSQTSRDEKIIDVFEKNLTVYPIGKSRVISLNFSSKDPQFAAQATNAIADAYIIWQRDLKLRKNKGASEWLEVQIKDLRKKVATSEEKVERYRALSGLQSGRNNTTLSSQQLSELNSQLILAKAQRSEAEVRAKLISDTLKRRGDISAASDVMKSALIQRLLEQKVSVQRARSELSATLLPSHPRMKQLTAEYLGLDKQIKAAVLKIVQSLRNEAEIAGAREASLRKSLNDLKKESSAAGEQTIKLRAYEREAKANRNLLESYLARYNEANARRGFSSVPVNAQIISRAYISSTPSFPKIIPLVTLAIVASVLLCLGVIISAALLGGAQNAAPRKSGNRKADAEPVAASNPAYDSQAYGSQAEQASSQMPAQSEPIAEKREPVVQKPDFNPIASIRRKAESSERAIMAPSLSTAQSTEQSGVQTGDVDFNAPLHPAFKLTDDTAQRPAPAQAVAAPAPIAGNIIAESVAPENVMVESVIAENTIAQPAETQAQTLRETTDAANSEAQPAQTPPQSHIMLKQAQNIAEELYAVSSGKTGFRVLLTSDSGPLEAASDVIEIARDLAGKDRSVVLLDASENNTALANMLQVRQMPGLKEIICNQAAFEKAVHKDAKSAMHIISAGDPAIELEGQEDLETMRLVFDALDQTYDMVLIYAPLLAAQDLFEELDAGFDAGVMVYNNSEPEMDETSDGVEFIGFTVRGLYVIRYDKRPNDKRAEDKLSEHKLSEHKPGQNTQDHHIAAAAAPMPAQQTATRRKRELPFEVSTVDL